MVRQSNIQKVLDICLRYKPSKVLLFGSSARGPVEDANDIDLVFYAQTETLPLATWADLIKDIGNGGVEDHVDLVLAETVPSHVLQEWEAYGRVLFQTGTQPTPVPSPLPAAARPIDPHLQEINHLVDELHLFSDNGGTLARLGFAHALARLWALVEGAMRCILSQAGRPIPTGDDKASMILNEFLRKEPRLPDLGALDNALSTLLRHKTSMANWNSGQTTFNWETVPDCGAIFDAVESFVRILDNFHPPGGEFSA